MKQSPTHFLLVSLACVLALCNCQGSMGKKQQAQQIKAAPVVEGFVVKPKAIRQIVTVSGTLKPFEETVLMPEVAGRVVELNLPEGKSVKQGTLLVKLFDGDLQASLQKSQAQLLLAQQTEKRQAELIKISGISQSDYDQAVLLIHSINADIEIIKAQIRKTLVLAPFDGVIGLRAISMGAEVSPGMALADIRAVHQLKLDFSVPEKYGMAIKSGLGVLFSVQGSDEKNEAVVIASERGIDAATRNLKVRAVVKHANESLIPGAFATVDLELGVHESALMVPTQTIIPQENAKQVIVSKNGKAVFVTIETGVRQATDIEVVKGLSASDTVVTTGILFIKPGMDLKFSKVTQ